MTNKDIFYTILLKLRFFSQFFYKQYIIDLTTNTVEDIKNNKTMTLRSFYHQHPIKDALHTTREVTYLADNGLFLKDPDYPNHVLVLYINTNLHVIDTQTMTRIDIALLNDDKTIEQFLYKNSTHPIYIVYLSFYSSLDLSSQEIANYIFTILKESLQEVCCYFQHVQYNCYCLIFSGLDEVPLLHQLLTLKREFLALKKPYLNPRFLVVQYIEKEYGFEQLLVKVKHHFLNTRFEEQCVIKKEDAKNI